MSLITRCRLEVAVRQFRNMHTRQRNQNQPLLKATPNNNEEAGQVVLVTGGAGFLGQHVVHLLQTRASHVTRIRILDLKPYEAKLGSQLKNVESIVGSVTNRQEVEAACQGVDSVYHIAGMVSYGTIPDVHGMYNVNVEGTSNIIEACLHNNVKRLIFCSTVDVVIGYNDIIDGTEQTTQTPQHFLFPGYPQTKYTAECLVLKANGEKGINGQMLRTLSLRANVMYGEGDPYYVTSGLKSAQRSGGVLYQLGDGSAKFQPAYVGNTAWAFICADKALRTSDSPSGQAYFIPDDTPVQNTFLFLRPFLEARNMTLSKYKLPFSLIYNVIYVLEIVAKFLSPLVKIQLPTESYSLKYINMNLSFCGDKAHKVLGFSPIFQPHVARQRCAAYYMNVSLE